MTEVIVEATKQLKNDEDLSITIIQGNTSSILTSIFLDHLFILTYFCLYIFIVGTDNLATEWLKEIDDELVKKRGAAFDIVDVVSNKEMKNFSFAELIRKSVSD